MRLKKTSYTKLNVMGVVYKKMNLFHGPFVIWSNSGITYYGHFKNGKTNLIQKTFNKKGMMSIDIFRDDQAYGVVIDFNII